MTPRLKLGLAFTVCATIVVVLATRFLIPTCAFRESSPSYSPDKRFYTQMEVTVCRDQAKSHARLVMGVTGKSDKTVLLDFGPSLGSVNLSWHDGPTLYIEAPKSAITHRYGPYENLPKVVVTNP
jgi:hypothetical protein